MIHFDKQFFQKHSFTRDQIRQYIASMTEDLEIAKENTRARVKFNYSYQALIRCGIILLAHHGYKVRSKVGHHIKIIDALSEILNDTSIADIGNVMRQKRNTDFYGIGIFISDSESQQYYAFVESTILKAKKILDEK